MITYEPAVPLRIYDNIQDGWHDIVGGEVDTPLDLSGNYKSLTELSNSEHQQNLSTPSDQSQSEIFSFSDKSTDITLQQAEAVNNSSVSSSDIRSWDVEEVVRFIEGIPNCSQYAKVKHVYTCICILLLITLLFWSS